MQSKKHMVALGLLGAFGIMMATGTKKPLERPVANSAPPVDRKHMALVASYVVSASDVCLRANLQDPNAVDSATLAAYKEACTRAAEEQARQLNWDEGEWVPEDPTVDAPSKRLPVGAGRVARRPGATDAQESSGRDRN